MVKFYIDKIKNAIINPNTGDVWTIQDVPTLWRTGVQKELKK